MAAKCDEESLFVSRVGNPLMLIAKRQIRALPTTGYDFSSTFQ